MFRGDEHIARAVARRATVVSVDDTGPLQLVTCQGLAGELFKNIIRAQSHGLSGVPVVGALGWVILSSGRPDQAFFVGGEDPNTRPAGKAAGEAVLYGGNGQLLFCDAAGNIIISAPNGVVHINPT